MPRTPPTMEVSMKIKPIPPETLRLALNVMQRQVEQLARTERTAAVAALALAARFSLPKPPA